MMFWPSVPATRWYRSVYALLSDLADAVTTLTPPRLPSPESLATWYHWEEVAGCVWLANVSGCATGGIHSGELPFRVLVCTFMPCDRARASTYGLNEDPTCSLFCRAMSYWHLIWLQMLVGSEKLGPPYMAQISPVVGCSSTAPTCAYQGSALPSLAIRLTL